MRVPVWIKPSALIICIAGFLKDSGWIFPFHNLKGENITFCYYYSCFSVVQFLCLSQSFLSTDQNDQCNSFSFSTSHNPAQTSTAWPEVFYTSSVGSASPTWMSQASWAYQRGLHRYIYKQNFSYTSETHSFASLFKARSPSDKWCMSGIKMAVQDSNFLTHILKYKN